MTPHVERLDARHDRQAFHCGVPSLDRYIRQQVGQDVRRALTACYVLAEPQTEQTHSPRSVPIIGYYTLSMTAIRPLALPEEAAKRLGRYESYPALLLGRLAVDRRYRGQRHGEYLLLDAMRQAARLSSQAGAIALVVDALDEAAARFYERFGFLQFHDAALRLYLPIASCRAAVAGALTDDEVAEP